MSTLDRLVDLMPKAPPAIALPHIQKTVEDTFGIGGDYTALVSERDQNFKLVSDDGRKFVVKVTGSGEATDVTACQIGALLRLEEKGVHLAPRVVRTLGGHNAGQIVDPDSSVSHSLRVVTYLDGQPLAGISPTPALCEQLGERIAEMDTAFAEFSHAGDRQCLVWDTQRANDLDALLTFVDDKLLKAQLGEVFVDFSENIQPRLAALPTQIIHNDVNSENVLVNAESKVVGIIDFGDLLRAPRIIEAATAAAYLFASKEHPLKLANALLAGYERVSPLTGAEIALFVGLIRTRLAMSLSILFWRLSVRNADDPYRQKSIESAAQSRQYLDCLLKLK